MIRRLDTPLTRVRARQLRKKPSPAEAALWRIVRGRQIAGVRIHRRAIVLGSIPDFWCPAARVAIEIDGNLNEWKRSRDARRDRFYLEHGVLTLHLSARVILQKPMEAATTLTAVIEKRLSHLRN